MSLLRTLRQVRKPAFEKKPMSTLPSPSISRGAISSGFFGDGVTPCKSNELDEAREHISFTLSRRKANDFR
jgi:hypothetical protein